MAFSSFFAAAGRRTEFVHGARDTVPLLLGAAPFGLIFGALAAASPLGVAGALAMSALVFAGSAQFIALGLLSGGAGGAVVVFTTLVVNLRHLLYAASLQQGMARLPQRWRVLLGFWLTDETYAVVHHRYVPDDGSPWRHWYTAGSGAAMYASWLGWTAAGALLGQTSPALTRLGLQFALVATFVGIVALQFSKRRAADAQDECSVDTGPPSRRRPPAEGESDPPRIAVALTAAVVALLAHGLPYQLGLLLAALAGVLVGVWRDVRASAGGRT